MTIEDYLISLLLVSVVIRQLHGRRITVYSLVWPVLLVVFLGSQYFKGISTGGNDIAFVLLVGLIGLALGLGCGLFTKIFRGKDGKLVGKATGIAVALWILGTSARIVFALYAQHGGATEIASFSRTFHLTSVNVWVNALLLMSLAEVGGRTIALAIRALLFVRTKSAEPATTPVTT